MIIKCLGQGSDRNLNVGYRPGEGRTVGTRIVLWISVFCLLRSVVKFRVAFLFTFLLPLLSVLFALSHFISWW